MGLFDFLKKNKGEDEPTLTSTTPITQDDIINHLMGLDKELEQLVLNYKSVDEYNKENNLASGVPLRNIQSQIDAKTNEINSYLDANGVDQNFYRDIYYTYRSPNKDNKTLMGTSVERQKMLNSYLSEGRQLFPSDDFGEMSTTDLQSLWTESTNRESQFRDALALYHTEGDTNNFNFVMDKFLEARDRTDRIQGLLDNRGEPYSPIASIVGKQAFERSEDFNTDYLNFDRDDDGIPNEQDAMPDDHDNDGLPDAVDPDKSQPPPETEPTP